MTSGTWGPCSLPPVSRKGQTSFLKAVTEDSDRLLILARALDIIPSHQTLHTGCACQDKLCYPMAAGAARARARVATANSLSTSTQRHISPSPSLAIARGRREGTLGAHFCAPETPLLSLTPLPTGVTHVCDPFALLRGPAHPPTELTALGP